MATVKRIADLAQKGAVVGLLSMFGYQVYQIGHNLYEFKFDSQYAKTDTFGKISAKVDEEEKLKEGVSQQPDVYASEDNSYLKKVPNLQEPVAKQSK